MTKKVLLFLLMLMMASNFFAINLPDPVITVEEGEEYYVVDAQVEGDYEISVFCNNRQVETPYAIPRLDDDRDYLISAYARLQTDDGCFYSNIVELMVQVPALEEQPQPGPYPPHWPYFQVTEGDRYYTVTAHCIEEGSEYISVRLYCDGILVDNPYIIERTHEAIEYVFEAWAHCDGYEDLSAEMAIVVPALEEPVSGDMNGDKEVGIADVNTLINAILSSNGEEKYDLNGDGEVTVADVMALINLIIWAN